MHNLDEESVCISCPADVALAYSLEGESGLRRREERERERETRTGA
jgi:hypothetical protein